MIESADFTPGWVSPPGDTIADLLEERGWDQAEFALRTDFSRKHVNELVLGKAPLSPDAAERLSRVLGSTSQFWLTREAHYRAALERSRNIQVQRANAAWLLELPLAWMRKQKWLRCFSDKGEQVLEALSFFGVASVEAWRAQYEQPFAAFRASDKFEKKLGAVAAWLRQAERQATELRCAPYNRENFRAILKELRELTREPNPQVFVPKLRELCASAGVAVVFVPAPPGCPVSGMTRWLSADRPLLALSLRYKVNDQLWFTVFHEACHVLQHARKQMFIEGLEGLESALEEEANRFAADLLIPRSEVPSLERLRTKREVEAKAHELGVAPGIIVGRMQKEKWIPYSHFNDLKIRYEW